MNEWLTELEQVTEKALKLNAPGSRNGDSQKQNQGQNEGLTEMEQVTEKSTEA